MKLSVKEERKQPSEQHTMIPKVRYSFASVHSPLFVNEGIRDSAARTVPVGNKFARLAAVTWLLWPSLDDEIDIERRQVLI